MIKPSTALKRAAKLVDAGWTKGRYEQNIDGKQCYCMSGALNKVITGKVEALFVGSEILLYDNCFGFVKAAVNNIATRLFHGIVYFNDEQARDKEDVVNVLNAAAEIAKENKQ